MEIFLMVIWFIGFLLTWGLILEDDPGVLIFFVMIFLWPVFLGMALRELIEKENK